MKEGERPLDIFKLFGKIIIGGADEAEDTIGRITGVAKKAGTALLEVGKVAGTALVAAGTAVAAISKVSLDAYANYEQLVGGVETLFKDSSDIVQQYAQQAYQTAGMSANAYMETVTSFSASLLQGLGGDTAKAAEYADMAIRDMSDNANKMGTNIGMIQNAYQGFAKQNYTMLDNLKLGYGGTREEMLRLLDDANRINAQQGKITNYSIDNLSDVYEAIHVVQEEMGIAGATADEAGTTIEGSFRMAKAAWENLVTGLADDNADLDVLIDNFVTSATTTIDLILPRVTKALNGASTMIDKLFPVIANKIPQIISDTLPKIVSSAVGIVKSLANGLEQNQEMLMTTAFDLMVYLAESFLEMLPQIVEVAGEIILSLVDGIAESLPELIPAVLDVIKKITDTITDRETLETVLDSALDVILAIAEGLAVFAPELIGSTIYVINTLVDFLLEEENLNKIIDAAVELIGALCVGLADSAGTLFEGTVELVGHIVAAIFEVDWLQVGLDIVVGIGEGLLAGWNNLLAEHPLFANVLMNLGTIMNGGVPSALDPSMFGSGTGTPSSSSNPRPAVGAARRDGVELYASGAVLNEPTAFAVNPYTGKTMIGGESGAEAIAPISTLQQYVKAAVQDENMAVVESVERIVDLLVGFIPDALDAMRTPMVCDTNGLAVAMAPAMNTELGRIAIKKGRGR